jgi:hypothetical protein
MSNTSTQRISKKELEKMFNVDRNTIENWRKFYGLPIIEISTHSKYIRINDLIEWENMHIKYLNSNRLLQSK